MKCLVCGGPLLDNVQVVPIQRWVVTQRGDFPTDPIGWIHLRCLTGKEL